MYYLWTMNAFWWWNRISVLNCTEISTVKLNYWRNANVIILGLITLQTASNQPLNNCHNFNIRSNKRLKHDANCSYVMMSLVLGWFLYFKLSTLIPLIFIHVWCVLEVRDPNIEVFLRSFDRIQLKIQIVYYLVLPSHLHWSESTVAVIFNGFKDMLSMPKMVKDDDDDGGSYIRNFIS